MHKALILTTPIAATPCVLISASKAYCYEVGGYGLMVVGHGVVKTSSSLFMEGGRRRLLSVIRQRRDEVLMRGVQAFSEWNHTAALCNRLVEAFLHGTLEGVLDMEALEGCIHWREVGRSIIHYLNLTSMTEHGWDCCSHAFMSVQDFVSVLIRNKGAAVQVTEKFTDVVTKLFKST
jgi:hypothetical protein